MINVVKEWSSVSIEVAGDSVHTVNYRIVRELNGKLLQEVRDSNGKPIGSGQLPDSDVYDERSQRFNLIHILADATHIMCVPT